MLVSLRLSVTCICLAYLAGFGLSSCRRTGDPIKPQATARTATYRVQYVPLAGYRQAILIQQRDRSKPTLLMLHGGPGNSEMTLAHVYGPLLAKHFNVVHWDQLGAGRSFQRGQDARYLTLERLIGSGTELAVRLRKEVGNGQLLLVGSSFGSLLGLKLVERHPELFCGYVGLGQLVHGLKGLQMAYNFALDEARRRGNQSALAELEALGRPVGRPTSRALFAINRWLVRFGGVLSGQTDWTLIERLRQDSPIRRLATELSGEDQRFSIDALLPAISAVDFLAGPTRYRVPLYFVVGDADRVTPKELVMQLYTRIEAPVKQLRIFKGTGHLPHLEKPRRFADFLLHVVARQTCR